MTFSYETSDGKKSIDRKVAKLVKYVNHHVKHMSDEEATAWAQRTIEQGIKNIASYTVAVRID
ncbi:MAG: hypothetical protein ABIG61_17845 [Planctomycetota bacterium]